jgi:DNA-binding GntR family transcriptional regulator
MCNNVNKKVPSILKDTQCKLSGYKHLYSQIKTLLTKSLINGEWQTGEMIPSEIELAKRYKVSQGKVRKTIETMPAENLPVERRLGLCVKDSHCYINELA